MAVVVKVDGWEFAQGFQPHYVLLSGMDSTGSFLLCDRFYGNARCRSLR